MVSLIVQESAKQQTDFKIPLNMQGNVVSTIMGIFTLQMENLNKQLERISNGSKSTALVAVSEARIEQRSFVKSCLENISHLVKLDIDKFDFPENSCCAAISFEEFEGNCKRTLDKILDFIVKDTSLRIVSHSFQIDIDNERWKKIAPSYDCVRYAFYAIGESKLEDWIFGKTNRHPFSSFDSVLEKIENDFGYVLVCNRPKAKDLIIYFNKNQEPVHFGVFSDVDTVYSKWGLNPQIIAHPVQITPYGDCSFKVYRKVYR